MLRYDMIRGRDMGALRGEFELDIASLPGPVVAIVGETGSGKSTLLELLQAAHERKCPTRGSLTELAGSRQSFVEAKVVNGRAYVMRQVVDGVSGKGESLVLDEAGEPVLKSSKVRDFDAWRERALPPLPLLLASTFAAQERRGILSFTDGEIKSMLLRVAGSEQLETLAKSARDRARETRSALEKVEARIAEATDGKPTGVDEAEKTLAEHEANAASLVEELTVARSLLAEREAEAARVAALFAQEQTRQAQRQDLQMRLLLARGRVVDLEKRLDNNRGVLTKANEIRAAKARADELDACRGAARERLAGARATADTTSARLEMARESHRALESMLVDANSERAGAANRARLLAQAKAEVQVLPHAREALAVVEQTISDVTTSIQRFNDIASQGAHHRIDALRGGLREITEPSRAHVKVALAEDTLAADDESARSHASVPNDIRAANERRLKLNADRGELSAQVARLERQQAVIDAAAPEPDYDGAIARLQQQLQDAIAQTGIAATEDDAVRRLIVQLSAEINDWGRERAELEPSLAMLERLTMSEARIAELEPQLVQARADADSLSGQLDLMLQPCVLPVAPDVETARASVSHAEGELAKVQAWTVIARAAVGEARERAVKLTRYAAERQLLAEDLADWLKLGEDLGRDGLQAMLVDDAGQEWMQNANDLLHGCIGPRWTVSLETQRPDADGKKMVEDTQFRVLDTERGRDAEGKTLSGGERALINESLSLALIAVANDDADGCTIIRDETSAPLDAHMARSYVSMLRRAAQMIGASKVLVAAHNAQVTELADARVEVSDGQIRVAA